MCAYLPGSQWELGLQEESDALAFIKRALEHETECGRLIEYLDLKKMGLRRQSLAKINEFVANTRQLGVQKKRYIVRVMCEKSMEWRDLGEGHWRSDSVFDSYPLTIGFITPTLQEWIADEPHNPEPLKWKGLFYEHGWHSLERCFDLDPTDDVVAISLMERYEESLAYGVHELLRSLYIGEPSEDLVICRQLERCLKAVKDLEVRASTDERLRNWRQIVEDWVEFDRNIPVPQRYDDSGHPKVRSNFMDDRNHACRIRTNAKYYIQPSRPFSRSIILTPPTWLDPDRTPLAKE